MKREEKEERITIFNKITITKEEQAFLTELMNAVEDLWEENEEDFVDSWTERYDILKKLAVNGSYEVGD